MEPPPGQNSSRGRVRAMEAEDCPRLAAIFLNVFRSGVSSEAGAARLAADLKCVFLDHPHYHPDSAALVYERANGEVGGMLGVMPAPMIFDGRKFLGNVFSTWMVEDPIRDREAGARLQRAHFRRDWSVVVADTANRHSVASQASLHMRFAAAHSLHWTRPLNYAAYAASIATKRVGLTRPEAVIEAFGRSEKFVRALFGKAPDIKGEDWRVEACSVEHFSECWLALHANYRLRPDWSAQDVAWILTQADRRPSLGPLRLVEIRDARGRLIGCCAYHINASKRGEALTLAATPRSADKVLRALFADAAAQDCALIGGASDPAIMQGLFQLPGVFYRHTCGAMVKSADPEVARAALAGEGVIGGLVGDNWTPFASESYD